MKLFLDTEFTDFIDIELISIGIVSEDGREFYAERIDFDESKCSQFVRLAVLPKLGSSPAFVGTKLQIKEYLEKWLSQFDSIEVCVDYLPDWELFVELLDIETYENKTGVSYCMIGAFLNPLDIEQYWRENGRQNHHALHDAKANRAAFLCYLSRSH